MSKHSVLTAVAMLLLASCAPSPVAATSTMRAQAAPQQSTEKSNQPRLGPEEIAAIKAQNAKAVKMNEVIAQVNAAIAAKDWSTMAAGSRMLIEMDPGRYTFYSMLGSALLNLEQCDEGLTVLDKGIQLAQDVTAPDDAAAKAKVATGLMLFYQGNCYLKMKKSREAVAAFAKAVPLDPNPGPVAFNLCATYYNMMVYEIKGPLDPDSLKAALAACSQAVEAAHAPAPAYFIRASFLIARTADHHGNVTFPPEAIAALKKYLELDPNGPYVRSARALLEAAGDKVQ